MEIKRFVLAIFVIIFVQRKGLIRFLIMDIKKIPEILIDNIYIVFGIRSSNNMWQLRLIVSRPIVCVHMKHNVLSNFCVKNIYHSLWPS